MRKISEISLNSDIYSRIEGIALSPSERQTAIAALEGGERIAELILGVAHALRMLVSTPSLKPDFKH
jgi:hypothetical protein